jgi:hypothetical protein
MSSLASLRNEAYAARAANDPNRAAAAWRALLDAAPDDWGLALELKQDLRAGLHYPDSDPRFRRAARRLPDSEWLAHYAALYAFHGSDLEAIDARACALLQRWPADARLHAIRGDVARQRRDWAGAVQAFADAARLDPQRQEYAQKAEAARRYEQLSHRPWPEHGPRYAAYVVNLDRNAERMVELGRQFAGCPVPIHRQAAVEGSRLPAAAVLRLTGDAAAPRGTLGCFLSHAAAWESLLASGDSHGLILEDDVIPLLDLPATLGGLGLPDETELCFVNDRLEPKTGRLALGAVTLAEAMAGFHPDDNAPGGDGYVLSRGGAAKLLDWVGSDGFAHDVDWRLLAYALTADEVAGIPAHAYARQELDRLGAQIPRPDRLRACALVPALIRTVGVSSDREDQNRLHPS